MAALSLVLFSLVALDLAAAQTAEGLSCPSNQCSETGFMPCSSECPISVILSPTTVVDQEVVGIAAVLIFRCVFTPPSGYPGLLYDVYWYVNDRQVAKFTALPSDRVSTDGRLQETAWNKIGLGMVVKCSLRARYNETLPPAQHFFSQPFFAGLEVEKSEIVIREGNEGSVRIRSTVPTPFLSIGGQQRGNLEVLVFTPNDQSRPDFGQNDVIFSPQRCGVGIPNSLWHDWQELKIIASVDGRFQNSRISLLRLGVKSDLSDMNRVWTNVTIPDIKITITDEDRQLSGYLCVILDDTTLMNTFNKREYEHPNKGEFILYKHALYPVSVHVEFVACKSPLRITCTCAVAVHAFDSLFVVDRCRGRENATVHLNHSSYANCNDRHLVVERNRNNYRVRLPTGTLVTFTISQDFIYGVFVYPSPADIGQTRGLCGQLHPSTPNMDMVLRDGTATGDVTTFINAWRVSTNNDSLFVENPALELRVPVLPYCFCSNNNPTSLLNSINCSLPYPVSLGDSRYSTNLKAFLHSCGNMNEDTSTTAATTTADYTTASTADYTTASTADYTTASTADYTTASTADYTTGSTADYTPSAESTVDLTSLTSSPGGSFRVCV